MIGICDLSSDHVGNHAFFIVESIAKKLSFVHLYIIDHKQISVHLMSINDMEEDTILSQLSMP